MEYAIRLDSQATDQENCLLSSKYGLCKRPNTNYLTTIKTEDGNATANDIDCVVHPLHYGDDSRILVGFRGETGDASTADFKASTTEKWKLFDEAGNTNVITHFPSSSDAAEPAISEYPKLSETPATTDQIYPKDITFATIGDFTLINHANVRPKMSTATWKGYQETYTSTGDGGGGEGTRTIENDEVFCIWFKAHQLGEQRYNVTIQHGTGAENSYTITTDNDDQNSETLYNDDDSGSPSTLSTQNDTKAIAGRMAFQISNTNKYEATTLSTAEFAVANNAINGGTSVVTGRIFDDMDPEGNVGDNFEPSTLHSVTASGARDETNVKVAHKNVKGISDLPPRSWIDHTVKVQDPANEGGDAFHMRFISDEDVAQEFVRTQDHPSAAWATFGIRAGGFGSDSYAIGAGTAPIPDGTGTMKLPRKGHWEESCGVGSKTTIDTSTMPHVLFRRSDGSFVMMEARGSFQINTTNDQIVFTGGSTDTALIQLDAGFSDDGGSGVVAGTDPVALLVGDTIQFDKVGGTGTFPPELKENTDYFIISVTKAARAYSVKLSETEGGDAIEFTAGTATLTDCVATLTTYKLDSWQDRKAGDDTTNPLPDMFHRKINKIFTYQNRLGFCTDKDVFFSASGDPFTVFRTTVRDLLDDDPFSVTPTDTRGDIIKDAIGYGQNLVVFTNEAQHIVRALDGRFTAKTVEIVNATQATCDFDPHPVIVRDSLFFTYSTSGSGGVWEMRPSNQRNNTWTSTDISDQVPGYLPKGARTLIGSSKHGMLFYFNERPASQTTVEGDTDDTSSSDFGKDQNIYVYTFLDGPDGRVQSAWTKWLLNADKETGHSSAADSATGYRIVNATIMSDRLYLITSTKSINNGGGGVYDTEFYLEYIDLDMKTEDSIISEAIRTSFKSGAGSPSTEAVVMLDRRVANSACTESYDAGTGDTTISPPWKFDENMKRSLEVVTSDGTRYTVNNKLTITAPTSSSAGIIVVDDINLLSVDYWVGFQYSMISVFGPFAPRADKTPIRGRNIYVRGGRMTYTMATEFDISVTQGGTTYTETIAASSGTTTSSGEGYFGIRKHMPELAYTITNANPFNAMIQGMMYDLNVQEVMSRG